jgi:tetratricopeptide (TPR) repeat protein
MSPAPDIAASSDRVVRVFISSTFRDMRQEREELVKRVFPQLRRLCEARGVTWGEVDLRWGISDEQSAEGKVLPICLAEIQRCRPYFIALLGERYGWVPNEIDESLVAAQPWLAEHRARSITELEILHGVLNDPEMASHAFFYLRDPSYVQSRSKPERADLLEAATAEEVERLGREEAERRAAERKENLRALKARIRVGSFPVREYPDPTALGDLVLADLSEVIEGLFPEGSEPDPLDHERAEHEAFARSRSTVYVGRPGSFERLDAHATGDEQPLVVLGESGSGKSALLANWVLHWRETHPADLVLVHFVGATAASSDWARMVRRLVEELDRQFGIDEEVPDDPEALRVAFANRLHMAAARGRTVLVIDALNQLEDKDGAPDLVWLPVTLPPEVRLIVSTLPGRPLLEIERRGWPTLEVEPLEREERHRFTVGYLHQYTKELSSEQLERILEAPQTSNPLFLRALLEELRLWGEHETIAERIGHYLEARSIADLYGRILRRYEEDYERDRPGLVRDALSLIWAARRGLSESELLDLLGTDRGPLPQRHWSPLLLAAEQSFVNRGGLIGFSHDYFRQAILDRYMPTEEDQQQAHVRLGDYFEPRKDSPRAIDELPWQLARAASWRRLHDLLADVDFLTAAWAENKFDVQAYWASLESASELRLVRAYEPIVKERGSSGVVESVVASLLDGTGHPHEAFILRERSVERYRRAGDLENLQRSLGNQALILRRRGRLEEALALHKEEEWICRGLGDVDSLQRSLGNQALILQDWGRLEEAMALYEEKERICRQRGNREGLHSCLGNQATILANWGRLDEAMSLHQEQERICRELGDKKGLEIALSNQAVMLKDWGRLDEAMTLHQEAERICVEIGDRNGLQGCLGSRALILQDWGRLEEAMSLLQEQERIGRELGNEDCLKRSLGNQALILQDWGRLEEAMSLHKEEERICRKLGDVDGLQHSFGNQALILQDWGRLDEAMALHKEKERICRELGNLDSLQNSLANQAGILRRWGGLDEAMELHKEQERICRELGSKDGLQRSLTGQGLILTDWGRLDEAMELHKEQERICRELGNQKALHVALRNQGLILADRGRLDEAMALLQEEEQICREFGYRPGLPGCLASQAWILKSWGRFDEALALHREEEGICRELGDSEGLQDCLGSQALILADRGRLDEALILHQEQERICRELGNKKGLQAALSYQAGLLSTQGQQRDALALYREQEFHCRELDDRANLAICLANQAGLLIPLGDKEAALRLAEEAEEVATALGTSSPFDQLQQIFDFVRRSV